MVFSLNTTVFAEEVAVDSVEDAVEATVDSVDEVAEEATKNLKDVMLQKIAEGRLAKFLKEGCLLDQTFLMDDTKTVKAYLDDASKELNSKLEVTTFRRWKCGEAAPKAEEAAE